MVGAGRMRTFWRRKRRILGSWWCSGCGALTLVARWASWCCLLYERRNRGQKYPGRCQLYNIHSGNGRKILLFVSKGLDMLPNFSFWAWQLPRPSLVAGLSGGMQVSVIIYPSRARPPALPMIWTGISSCNDINFGSVADSGELWNCRVGKIRKIRS